MTHGAIKKVKDIKPGDFILGSDGKEVEVLNVFEAHVPERMFELEFLNSKKETVHFKVSGNHLWYIESKLDKTLHSQRLSEGKKLFGKMNDEQKKVLLDTANSKQDIETRLVDMVELLDAHDDVRKFNSLVRIAESIGPVSENNEAIRDLYDDSLIEENTLVQYDAKRFAQQILSISGKREWRKKWPVIVGQVVKTVQIFEMDLAGASIPEIETA